VDNAHSKLAVSHVVMATARGLLFGGAAIDT